uniref:Protein naked cuticle homolog n=1 Tax=Eptatretus burgeri TaxID=7764 RepID=A0A8C4QM34_EPTBU
MGKLHSKHAHLPAACRRRESPEGDSFVANAYVNQPGVEDLVTEQKGQTPSYKDFPYYEAKKDGFSEYALEAPISPEKVPLDYGRGKDGASSRKEVKHGSSARVAFHEVECDISMRDDNRQEWTFTLYDFDNSGKITREDIGSLMSTIYEVVDTSVNNNTNNSKTLKVKLTVTPDSKLQTNEVQQCPDQGRAKDRLEAGDEGRVAERKQQSQLRRQSGEQHLTQNLGRQCYCLDENVERRNHYLDLAGMENYTSRFEPSSPQPVRRTEHKAHRSRSQDTAAHRVDIAPTTTQSRPPRGSTDPCGSGSRARHVLSGHPGGPVMMSGPRGSKHRQPAPWSAAGAYGAFVTPQVQFVPPTSHKKHRQRVRDSYLSPTARPSQHQLYHVTGPQPGPPPHEAVWSPEAITSSPATVLLPGEAMTVPALQRHDHHHFHEHHHHHHYHHYYEA